ncbi:MAG TPA: hypothetical protein VFB36_09850 [Nevskiaceae bacterium]|nr:hypothetical protein [Nevskiaceae bacterium]
MLAAPASAHHGKDFLEVESFDVPRPGDLFLLTSADASFHPESKTLGIEPGLLIGIFSSLAAEVHGHFAKEEAGSLHYEAIAPALHYQVTAPDTDIPLQLGIAAEYEFVRESLEQPDRFEGRLIVGHRFSSSTAAFNVLVERLEGEAPTLGYAAAYRAEIAHGLGLGFEALGWFERDRDHDLLLGAYFGADESLTLKVGAGAQIGAEDTSLLLQAALVYRPYFP